MLCFIVFYTPLPNSFVTKNESFGLDVLHHCGYIFEGHPVAISSHNPMITTNHQELHDINIVTK